MAEKAELSRYVNVNAYDNYEEYHPYYIEMRNEIINEIGKFIKEKFTKAGNTYSLNILEIGPGTGLLTKKYLSYINNVCKCYENLDLNIKIDLVELDFECYKLLENISKDNRNEEVIINLYNEDIMTKCLEENSYDLILSSFSNHHIPYSKAQLFYIKISDSLHINGKFIYGEEYIPDFNPDNEDERIRSIFAYHNRIIFEAMSNMLSETDEKEKNAYFKLAELEYIALQQGMYKDGEYKVSEKQAKHTIKKAKLNPIVFKKIGPIDIKDWGGVYFCVVTKE